jgi:uncharacterized protein DUF6874
MPIKWTATNAEHRVINQIVARAMPLLFETGNYPAMELKMDLQAVHCNGCPLALMGLLVAKDFDFAHDIFGIIRHLDRSTGKLGDCFLPRYAATCQGMVV